MESFGVKAMNDKPHSHEDKQAEEIFECTTKRVGSRFKTGQLWREDNPVFPKSKAQAMKRLFSIEKKMDNDESYAQQYLERWKII